MPMECSVYALGMELTVLRRRLEEEDLSPREKEEILERIAEIEKQLEV